VRIFRVNNRSKSITLLFLSLIVYIFLIYTIKLFLDDIFYIENFQANKIYEYIELKNIVIVVLFTSLLEELKYRLFLTKFNLNYIAISISIFISEILFLIFREKELSLLNKSVYFILSYYFILSLLSLLMFFLIKKYLVRNKNKVFYLFNKNFLLIIWLQIITFSLWHIFFTNQIIQSHYVVVFIINSIAAIYFTSVRINYGILYSILIHFSVNFLGFFLILIKNS